MRHRPRVHRLTSKHPVNVYVVVPENSLAEQKWQLLKDKGGASDLAFDGELVMQNEEEVDWEEILRNMKKKGLSLDGTEIHEADVEEQWAKLAYTAPASDRLHRRSSQPRFITEKRDISREAKPAEAATDALPSNKVVARDEPKTVTDDQTPRKKKTLVKETVVSLEEHQAEKARKEGKLSKAPKKRRLAPTGTDAMFDFGDDGTIEYEQDSLFDI